MKIKASYRADTLVWTAAKEKQCRAGKKYCTIFVNGDEVRGYVKKTALKAKGLEKIIREKDYTESAPVQESQKTRPYKKFKQGKMGGSVERKPIASTTHVPKEFRKRPEK